MAGNVVNDFVMGSILFAVQHLGCRLVVVLGHSRCSVVASAVQSWARQQSSGREEQSVRTLAEGVQQTLSSGSSASHISPPKSEVILILFWEAWLTAVDNDCALQAHHGQLVFCIVHLSVLLRGVSQG